MVVITAEEEEWEEASVVVAVSAAGAAGLDQLETVSVAVASTQHPRRSVARADPSEWDHAEAELASACRIISGLSTLMDELHGPYLRRLAQELRLVGSRIVSAQHAILLCNGRRQGSIAEPTLQRRVYLKELHTGD